MSGVATGRRFRAGAGGPARVAVWIGHLALPLVGLWVLIASPELDGRWEDHPAHFWLVGVGSAIAVGIGLFMARAARHRADARLYLVSLAFLATAGFQMLHALATPGVVVPGRNAGFVLASPVGLVAAALFAGASAIDLSDRRGAWVVRNERVLRWGLVAVLAAWALVSVLGLPPLDRPLAAETARGLLAIPVALSVLVYALAAAAYFRLHRRRPAVVLLGVLTGFALLAETMIGVLYGRAWQASWWEWHLLQVAAFAFVAYSVHVAYRREGDAAGLFDAVTLAATVRRIEEEHRAALEEFVAALRSGERSDTGRLAASLGARFSLSEGQAEVLGRAADALASEREQGERLDALVAVGREGRIGTDEPELVERALDLVRPSFPGDRLDVELGGAPPEATLDGRRVVVPLEVQGRPAGALVAERSTGHFQRRDVGVLEALAAQLQIALENVRLYGQLDGLFRSYLSPDVAAALIADPSQAALGGEVREVTVLMADLRGFTPYAERSAPEDVVAMLNRHFGVVVPIVLAAGGTVVQFVGDAIMAVFNAPSRQPDHAQRAARAALDIQRAIADTAAADEPRFRVGLNTGPALVGNIGAEAMRNFTAIGDTTNTAARLEALAHEGQVVVSRSTLDALPDGTEATPLGSVTVKGKSEPVEVFALEALPAK